MKHIHTPLTSDVITSLKAGDEVRLSGVIYTARDRAHERLVSSLSRRRKLPFDIKGQVVYYCGPTETPPGKVIGSCGPTTSSRMDAFTPALLTAGLRGMIGKGGRSPEVIEAMKKTRSVYFLAYAGCGALLAAYVSSHTIIAYHDLGPEAIHRLQVEEFPLTVGIDWKGRTIL